MRGLVGTVLAHQGMQRGAERGSEIQPQEHIHFRGLTLGQWSWLDCLHDLGIVYPDIFSDNAIMTVTAMAHGLGIACDSSSSSWRQICSGRFSCVWSYEVMAVSTKTSMESQRGQAETDCKSQLLFGVPG